MGRKNPKKKQKRDDTSSSLRIPTLHTNELGFIDYSVFVEKYNTYQAVHIIGPISPVFFPEERNDCSNKEDPTANANHAPFSWRNVHSLFLALNDQDKNSWTLENCNKEIMVGDRRPSPSMFLDEKNCERCQGYCSFIVQHDKEQYMNLLQRLPVIDLPLFVEDESDSSTDKSIHEDKPHNEIQTTYSSNRIVKMEYDSCIWFFFGWNHGITEDSKCNDTIEQPSLRGRPEHTDSVNHDGTFHYQLSGSKIWYLRPTEDLLHQMEMDTSINSTELHQWKQCDGTKPLFDSSEKDDILIRTKDNAIHQGRVKIVCNEGDILVVNTRLWWHSTVIPAQAVNTNGEVCTEQHTTRKQRPCSVPSLSYARDLYFSDSHELVEEQRKTPLTNLDGLYAANFIEAGTIIFTEKDMPDCELHRTKENPNCELVELEDGSAAIVSCRDITSGEFFCILESDEDDDDSSQQSTGTGDNEPLTEDEDAST